MADGKWLGEWKWDGARIYFDDHILGSKLFSFYSGNADALPMLSVSFHHIYNAAYQAGREDVLKVFKEAMKKVEEDG